MSATAGSLAAVPEHVSTPRGADRATPTCLKIASLAGPCMLLIDPIPPAAFTTADHSGKGPDIFLSADDGGFWPDAPYCCASCRCCIPACMVCWARASRACNASLSEGRAPF